MFSTSAFLKFCATRPFLHSFNVIHRSIRRARNFQPKFCREKQWSGVDRKPEWGKQLKILGQNMYRCRCIYIVFLEKPHVSSENLKSPQESPRKPKNPEEIQETRRTPEKSQESQRKQRSSKSSWETNKMGRENASIMIVWNLNPNRLESSESTKIPWNLLESTGVPWKPIEFFLNVKDSSRNPEESLWGF